MNLEEKKNEWLRKGLTERIRIVDGLKKRVTPSQLERIQEGDKSVLSELMLPKWFDWELLFEWAQNHKVEDGVPCILCKDKTKNFVTFKGKFICDNCFIAIKNKDD